MEASYATTAPSKTCSSMMPSSFSQQEGRMSMADQCHGIELVLLCSLLVSPNERCAG
jgi:hypothetical protein